GELVRRYRRNLSRCGADVGEAGPNATRRKQAVRALNAAVCANSRCRPCVGEHSADRIYRADCALAYTAPNPLQLEYARVDPNDRRTEEVIVNLHLSIGPLVSLIAGILILLVPRLLNYIVAIYLIIMGLIGIFPASGVHFS